MTVRFKVTGLLLPRRRQAVVAEALELAAQVLHLCLHLDHATPHAEDDVDAGQVHAQVANQSLDLAEPRNVRRRVEPLPAPRARWEHQAGPFVVAQRLGVHADQSRRDADDVAGLLGQGLFLICHVVLTSKKAVAGARCRRLAAPRTVLSLVRPTGRAIWPAAVR